MSDQVGEQLVLNACTTWICHDNENHTPGCKLFPQLEPHQVGEQFTIGNFCLYSRRRVCPCGTIM